MARKTKVYFATDLHGSSKCFRKFVNAGTAYGVDVLVLGGDIAGKALQTIVRGADGRYRCSFVGTDYDVEEGPDLGGAREAHRRPRLLPVPGRGRRARRPARRRQPRRAVRRADASAPRRVAGPRRRAPPAERQAPLLHARQRRPGRAPDAPRRGPMGRPRRGPGGHARRRPRDDLVGLLEHHAVAQSPRDDRGPAGDRDRRDGRPTPGPRAGDRQRPRPAVRERARRGARSSTPT